uniref:thiamine diphosphokinase n=2 Tax=Physcomitrium patens TaxID=3218 RepID=A0A7I4D3F0_PHYPA
MSSFAVNLLKTHVMELGSRVIGSTLRSTREIHIGTLLYNCLELMFPIRRLCCQSNRIMAGVMKHVTDYTIHANRGSNHEAAGHSGRQGNHHSESSAVLVLLNYRLPRFTPLLWSQACLRVCADGGANRLYDELPQFFPRDDPSVVRLRHKPDVIKGDLDSIRADVRDYYEKLGTIIIDQSHDQETTDLHKCIRFIKESTPQLDKTLLKVLVVGALGGRFDHEAANINVLWTFANSLRIILFSEESSLTLLPTGYVHEIHVDRSFEGPHCGLVPVGAPSLSTTSTGLYWNLGTCLTEQGRCLTSCFV